MCSGIKIICKDGTILLCRTLEFAHKFKYSTYVTEDMIAILGDGIITDVLNKYGLCVMPFYYIDYDEYSDKEVSGNINISPIELAGYLAKNMKNIKDIKKAASKITVLNTIYKPWGIVPPLHWFCADKSGECAIIEVVKGELIVQNNDLEICANAPSFPIQKYMLRNYPKFTNYNTSGLIGLPGDFGSLSRFARLNIFQKLHEKPKNVLDGVNTAFHILNNFDIVKGYVEDHQSGSTGEGDFEFTQYTSVFDLTNFNAWSKTYDNQEIKNIKDLSVIEKYNNIRQVEDSINLYGDSKKSLKNKKYFWILLCIILMILILIIILFIKNN
jgi:choloylglycine hydrolase